MTRQLNNWRIRLAFEPNRIARAQLEKIYEKLAPTQTRAISESPQAKPAATKRHIAKRGDQ